MDGDLLEIWGSQSWRKTYCIFQIMLKVVIFAAFMCRFKGRCLAQSLSSTSQGSEVIGHYEITAHKLGSGAYSSVNLAIDREAKRQVACKTIIRRTQADIDDVLKEVELLRKLRHVRTSLCSFLRPYTLKVLTLAYGSPTSMPFTDLILRGTTCMS
ncbi:hypothetical protein FRC20_002098 [Serendipita sp. 405]|nr:hypothetical protein FRC20_002098 [Serendipita sp. 405]